jgi:hypothetical protein
MLSRSAHGGLSRPTARRNALRKSLPRQPAEITDEQIARRAYEIYQARADGEGDALGDWLTAVRELRQRVDAPSETPSRGDRNVYP